MAETHVQRVHTESVVLDIGYETGALVIYTPGYLVSQEIEVSPLGNDTKRVHTDVHERRLRDRQIFAAVYPALPAGDYQVWSPDPALVNTVTIVGGEVAEIDWS